MKEGRKLYMTKYREEKNQEILQQRAAYREKKREELRIKNRNNYLLNKHRYQEKDRAYRLKKRYGITISDYEKMLADQKDRCAICNAHKDLYKTRLAVDHDHATGRIRGLLCVICNRRICGTIDRRAKAKTVQLSNIEFVERILLYYKRSAS